jgi:hypothetical protein
MFRLTNRKLFKIILFLAQITLIIIVYVNSVHFKIADSPSLLKVTSQNNIKCQWPKLKLLNPPGLTIGLGSKPGSGNTWTRHLLQLATGIQTGSVYNDTMLKRSGFPGEGIRNGSVLCVKSHTLHE